MTEKYDVAVIGGGPGGYAAAGRSAQLGMRTALVERDSLGGVCLNWGCIPTKALLDSSHLYEAMKKAGRFGLTCGTPSFEFREIIQRSRRIAGRMSKGIGFLMKQRGVTVIKGTGRIAGTGVVEVTCDEGVHTLSADHVILATGGRPAELPFAPFDGERVLHSTHAMSLSEKPRSLLVIGAGAIGMEFADFYRGLGVDVTVVEMMPSVLPLEDSEILKELNRSLRRKKIKVHVNTRVTAVNVTDSGVSVAAEGPKGPVQLTAERMLVAIGVRPNSENLGLEEVGIAVERGFVGVDERMQTQTPGIYAVGDLTGPPMLAHKATLEGVMCVNGLAGHAGFHPPDYSAIPGCTYCRPQVASVGLTEETAIEKGIEIVKGVFPFRANGRSIAMEESDGIVKLIFTKSDQRLLGAHILHAEGSELIAELGIALKMGVTAHDIALNGSRASDAVRGGDGSCGNGYGGGGSYLEPCLTGIKGI